MYHRRQKIYLQGLQEELHRSCSVRLSSIDLLKRALGECDETPGICIRSRALMLSFEKLQWPLVIFMLWDKELNLLSKSHFFSH